MRRKVAGRLIAACLLCGLPGLLITGRAGAEEGMWLLNHPPAAAILRTYGFEARRDWLLHIQRSSVRVEGSSGAFVSPQGLLLTNHHVGIDQVQRLSTPERNLVRDGFSATALAEELPCPGMEVQVLDSIVDVSDQVLVSTPAGADPAAALQARRRAMTRLEEEARARTGRDAEIVTLYQGGRFHLYLYKRYDDVRLVFAPEDGIANFGGDVDNFDYPRHAFDVCFFRVYENGRPLASQDWLHWSAAGVREGDLVFACGDPYRTRRGMTADQYRFERDVALPGRLQALRQREVGLRAFSLRCAEEARAARSDLLGVENGRKSDSGALAGLLDPAVFRAAVASDDSLRAWVRRDPERRRTWDRAWDLIRDAQAEHRRLYPRLRFFAHLRRLIPSELFDYALTLVEMAEELPRPSVERHRDYRDSALESVRLELLSPEPISEAFEIANLTEALTRMAEIYGGEDSLVTAALAGLSPAERARQLVRGCTLRDPEVRRGLAEGGWAALRSSDDPMIRLAELLAPTARRMRLESERLVEGPEEQGQALLAAARLARYGEEVPPDATGTLRLSFGTVKGYQANGASVPAFTTLGGLYKKWRLHEGRDPFDLPPRWVAGQGRVSADTPYNFLSTLDTVGGSSGSPVVNTRGEFVGIVFDGNLESLVWDYAWEETHARCIAVDARAIVEGLRGIYGAEALARELSP